MIQVLNLRSCIIRGKEGEQLLRSKTIRLSPGHSAINGVIIEIVQSLSVKSSFEDLSAFRLQQSEFSFVSNRIGDQSRCGIEVQLGERSPENSFNQNTKLRSLELTVYDPFVSS